MRDAESDTTKRNPAAVEAAVLTPSKPPPDEVYRGVTRIFAVVITAFGLVIIAVTLTNGGNAGAVGIWLGLIFTALGIGRLYLSLRSDKSD